MAEQKPTSKPTAKQAENDEAKPVTVEFIKPWGRYSRGDIAGFDAKKADKLLNGIKVAVKPGTSKAAPASDDAVA